MKFQSFIRRFRIFLIFYFASRGLSLISDAVTGKPLPDWITLIVLAGIALIFALTYLSPKIKQSSWLYKLYRYRSPAASLGMLVRPPYSPGILERLYLHIRPPKWCRKSEDELMIVYRDQEKLLREGALALGVLVQANSSLFKKGTGSAPANVLYTTESEVENPVQRLIEIAHKIFSLKGTKPEDPDELKFARMVSYELGRDFRVSVPDRLSQGMDATYTTIMVHRKHLPKGYLSNVYFPLLIHQESRAAMILPARYWPAEWLSDWAEA